MKNYSILLGAILGIFTLASCQKEVDVNIPDTDVVKYVPFKLNADIPQTRTTINPETWEMDWEDGDILYAVTTDEEWGVAYKDDKDGESIAEFTYSDGHFGTTHTISAGEHTFNFLYTAGTQKSYHRGASTTFSLYHNQSMDATAPMANLKKYDALAGQVTVTTPTDFANVSMDHLFTLMKVTIKNKTGNDMIVKKFEMETPGQLLTDIYTVSFGETIGITNNNHANTKSEKVTVTIDNGAISAGGELPVYFVIAPINNYSGDITFKVTEAVSDTEEQTYTKTNSVSGVTFNAGEYNTANFSLKEPDVVVPPTNFEWNLVTSSDQIVAGAEVVIAAKNAAVAMSQTQNENNRATAAISKTDDKITWVDESLVQVFEIVQGNSDNTFAFKCKDGANDGKYIYGGLTGNYLRTKSSVDANSSWTISVTDSGVATIKANVTGDNVKTWLRYNSSSTVFSCYASGQGDVVLYIKGEAADPNAKAIISNGTIDVLAPGVSANYSDAYSLKNINETTETIVVTSTENVLNPTANNGTVSFSMAPNYTDNAINGTVTLTLASDETVTAEIPVKQKASSLQVSKEEIVIPYDGDEATLTITSPEFGWTLTVDNEDNVICDKSSGAASASATTVTILSDVDASEEEQTIATLTIARTVNDPQVKQVVIKKGRTPAAGEVTYVLTFSAETNSASVQNYTSSWSATCNGFTWNLQNWNNNQNGWEYVKAGNKNAASVATIITNAAIPAAIKTVTITIDAVTVSKINSLKLYVASSNSFTNATSYSFDVAVGDQSVTIETPTADCFYKIEADCQKGTSNGLITVSKVVYSNL